MASDLFIIAAGKGSRMKVNVPKALVPITDEPCLTTTLQQLGSKFDKVVIVTNKDIQDQWSAYFAETKAKYPELLNNVHNVPISSGLGDGHAVLWGLVDAHAQKIEVSDDIVIAWGDVFFSNPEIIDELLSHPMYWHSGVVPAVLKPNPYVTLLVDEDMECMSADFSKYGENHSSGLHDQSVFRFKKSILHEALYDLHNAFWKNGRYITQGGELSMLYVFHHLYNTDQPVTVYQTDYPTLSFNTPEEVAHIQMELKQKWLSQSS
jgi:bifunctional N-acetylglucosamine-1-phosphate-uridyltransferase/glucosamine-1-phosphate-acetyltransferase GlmU-like protein